jgi:uncharacterized protein YoxC
MGLEFSTWFNPAITIAAAAGAIVWAVMVIMFVKAIRKLRQKVKDLEDKVQGLQTDLLSMARKYIRAA